MGKGLASELYDRMPWLLQTAGLNAFGLRNARRLWQWERYLDSIAETERMPRERQIQWVSQRLRHQLCHVLETVPRYLQLRPLLNDLQAPSVDPFEVLARFPIITRGEVVETPERFLSSLFARSQLVKTVTSGTTGTPFATYMDAETFLRTDALWWRRTSWLGYRYPQWIARLVGDPIIPMSDQHPRRPWRVSWVDRRLYLSTFHLTARTAALYFEVLEKRRPEYLMGYPSSLEILVGFASEAGFRPSWCPKAIIFSSEPMWEHQRAAIHDLFPCRIVGLYGSAERIISASQCAHDEYHLSLVDGYVEGQFGILPSSSPSLLTSLMNRAMPLIRFELGDVIHCRPDEHCACGRTLPLMSPVVTKQEDWVETPTGRRISPSALTWAFKDLKGVRRSQIVQSALDRVLVLMDTSPQHFEAAAGTVKERLGSILFGEIEVECQLDKDIPLLASGKTRFVVRNLGAT
jgi:phenylacetate-CoA ligase